MAVHHDREDSWEVNNIFLRVLREIYKLRANPSENYMVSNQYQV